MAQRSYGSYLLGCMFFVVCFLNFSSIVKGPEYSLNNLTVSLHANTKDTMCDLINTSSPTFT